MLSMTSATASHTATRDMADRQLMEADAMLDNVDDGDCDYDDDGQPSEYDEWQDYFGGDDWDHGQYDDGGDFF